MGWYILAIFLGAALILQTSAASLKKDEEESVDAGRFDKRTNENGKKTVRDTANILRIVKEDLTKERVSASDMADLIDIFTGIQQKDDTEANLLLSGIIAAVTKWAVKADATATATAVALEAAEQVVDYIAS